MAVKPIKFFDQFNRPMGGSNRLIPAAQRTDGRQTVPVLQYDTHRNITSMGLRMLRDIGRYLLWKYPIVQGAILEQAELSVGTFVPQFEGKDKAWGEQAEAWLRESDNVFDVRGWPYDRQTYLNGLISALPVNGTHWTLLTESRSGFPQVQVIGAHRIGGFIDITTVGGKDNFRPPTAVDGNGNAVLDSEGNTTLYSGTANPWAGLACIAGVIVNENGTPVAYRVYNDPPVEFVDISAQSLFPTFSPMAEDQLVGIPSLAVCAFDFQDIGETRDFEKIAQKASAAISIVETNESGEAPPGADFLTTETGTAAGDPTGLNIQSMAGGIYQYLKAGSGKLDVLRADRPTQNQREFEANIIRGCFYGLEWSADFTLDAARNGGAPTRVVCEKINRKCQKNQRLAARVMRRVDGFRISKAIKLGLLPPNDEWWRWSYQGPPRITADEKYSSDVAIAKIRAGLSCPQDEIEKEGGYWEETVDKLVAFRKRYVEACKAEGIPPGDIIWPTPNGPVPDKQTAAQADTNSQQ